MTVLLEFDGRATAVHELAGVRLPCGTGTVS